MAWIVEFIPIFNRHPEIRVFATKERAEQWAKQCGYLSAWPGKTKCKIYEKVES